MDIKFLVEARVGKVFAGVHCTFAIGAETTNLAMAAANLSIPHPTMTPGKGRKLSKHHRLDSSLDENMFITKEQSPGMRRPLPPGLRGGMAPRRQDDQPKICVGPLKQKAIVDYTLDSSDKELIECEVPINGMKGLVCNIIGGVDKSMHDGTEDEVIKDDVKESSVEDDSNYSPVIAHAIEPVDESGIKEAIEEEKSD